MMNGNGQHASSSSSSSSQAPGLDATIVDLFDGCAAKYPDRVAAEWQGQTLTYAALQTASFHVSRALLAAGVLPRAKVPLLTQMSLEMLPALLGILRVGACYAPMDVAVWSRERVEAALSEISAPVAVVTSLCPGLQKIPVLTVNFQQEWLGTPLLTEDHETLLGRLDLIRKAIRADDLAWIIFTSGTTGKPKGVMVLHRAIYAVSILEHTNDLETAAQNGGRCLLAYSIAFDGCAAVVWTTLTKGATLAMASPSSFPDVAATCDLLSLTPSMLASLDPSGPYDGVRFIFLGAEAPSLEIVRQWISPTRKVFNTYGPSETTCIISFALLGPDEEPAFGDLIPGVRVVLVDENLRECDHGEVMIAGPGLAAGYLNNPDLTAKKFISWHGERWYRTGDLARRKADGQLVWAGRADSLVKNRGFLINLETEVEPALESYSSVRLAVALKWRDRLIGCVQPATVNVAELRDFMTSRFDSFVVPDEIIAMESFPLNVNSKTDRHALAAQLEQRLVQDSDDLHEAEDKAEPEAALNSNDCQDHRQASSSGILRQAFSECLQIPSKSLDRNSSFTRLGGNSLAAIRLSNLLKKHGYFISVIQVLKLDTIGRLEAIITRQDVSQASGGADQLVNGDKSTTITTVSTPAVATDVQKLFLNRSLASPIHCALIGTTKYTGDPSSMPTAAELHDAIVKAFSAHSIFQTRFGLDHDFRLADLGRLNLEWHDVLVPEHDEAADFDAVCAQVEEQAWRALDGLTRTDNEVPYCHITCVSMPGRRRHHKALAFITRMHHVLTDVFSTAILTRDVERALKGYDIPAGPRFEDFARFMEAHKRENLARAIHTFENMVKDLPTTSILRTLPLSKSPPSSQGEEEQQRQQQQGGADKTTTASDLITFNTPTPLTRSALATAARTHGVTTATLVHAAWALFLHHITGWDRVGFRLSLSGRTVPWPAAQDVVGPLLCTAPFSVPIPTSSSPSSFAESCITAQQWLVEVVHKTTLDVLEFDGLPQALPEALLGLDKRTNTTNVLCFLDVPSPSSSSSGGGGDWKYTDRQWHNYLMDWYLFPDGEDGVKTVLEVQSRLVDQEWAEKVKHVPGRLLEELVHATDKTLISEILQSVA